MKRKLLLLMALLVSSTMAWAEEEWESDHCTVTLDHYGTLTVSGEGAMADYDDEENPAPWYENFHSDIYTVVIESGVTSI